MCVCVSEREKRFRDTGGGDVCVCEITWRNISQKNKLTIINHTFCVIYFQTHTHTWTTIKIAKKHTRTYVYVLQRILKQSTVLNINRNTKCRYKFDWSHLEARFIISSVDFALNVFRSAIKIFMIAVKMQVFIYMKKWKFESKTYTVQNWKKLKIRRKYFVHYWRSQVVTFNRLSNSPFPNSIPLLYLNCK